MASVEPSVPTLMTLLREGQARVPAQWALDGPEKVGLFWRLDGGAEVVGTPVLARLAKNVATEGEAVAALLATEPRYRAVWQRLEAARLRALGRRGMVSELCEAITAAGPAAAALLGHRTDDALGATGLEPLELMLFGAAADQPVAALPLRRALAATAPLVEGEQGASHPSLPPVHPCDPSLNWRAGRLLRGPSPTHASAGSAVLCGSVPPLRGDRMTWVLGTPWVTLLAVLGFTAEAWAAERRGGVQLELPVSLVHAFDAPPRVDVVVTLPDGREVLCGSLGELCVRTLDAVGMAMTPHMPAAALDVALAPVVSAVLGAGIWRWLPNARPRYAISDRFSFDCYRGEGHRWIYLASEGLCAALRSVCTTWALGRLDLVVGPS